MYMENFTQLEETINYKFQNKDLLLLALTHSSYANENNMPKTSYNERIEFLGDAVLELATSDFLYNKNPNMQEGELTKLRASLVCEESLWHAAIKIELGNYILLGRGEIITHGRERKSILSDALEALIGAIYLDGGFDLAVTFVRKFILEDVDFDYRVFDSKTVLQEIVQAHFGVTVTYKIASESGPEHDKFFVIDAYIKNKKYGTGEGHSKKQAAKNAAYNTIKILEEMGIGGKNVSEKH